MLARIALHVELDVRALNVGARELGCSEALDFFLTRSRLRGTRAGREAGNKVLQLRNLFLALRVFGFDARAHLRLGDDHVVVAADVHDDGFVVDVRGVRADRIQEMAIVRDDDQHAFEFVQIFLEPMHGIEVEVVGRLVEQQRGRRTEERLREQHADFLSALQFAHFAFVQIALDAEAVEQRARVGFGGVAAFFADDAFEFAEAHAVGVSELFVRLFVERVALLQRLPERRIAHDDGVDDTKVIKGELILAQDSEALWTGDRAGRRLLSRRSGSSLRWICRRRWGR